LRRTLYGARSERKERLIDQLEMQLEDAEADATEDELAAERASPSTAVKSFERKRPDRKPFPEHLPRERVVVAAPQSCPCCGSTRLSKLGEDVTETLEVVPRQWKVIQTVRGRFSCRQCEAIAQPPAPFHVTPRGFAGPGLLAMILFEKFGQHQPLNRQSERYAREGVDLSLLTLADQVGACAAALRPLHALIEAHVLSAERLHGDDTTVPILAKGQTETGRVWVYVRDDRPFDGKDPPAALFYASRDRNAGASRAASQRLCRHSASRRVGLLQSPLSPRDMARVAGPCSRKTVRNRLRLLCWPEPPPKGRASPKTTNVAPFRPIRQYRGRHLPDGPRNRSTKSVFARPDCAWTSRRLGRPAPGQP
jgi:transposase